MDEDIAKETNDNHENDVEIINKTIPEVIISDSSFESNTNSADRSNTGEESFANDADPAEITLTTRSSNAANFDEEQLIDLVVVDDDDDDEVSLPVAIKEEIKTEPKWPSDDVQNDETLDIKPKLNVPLKSDTKVNVVKNEDVNETKPNSVKSSESLKPPKDDIFLVHCAIRQSLSNETFVLQLDSSDALDCYLDKTADESLIEKPKINLGGTENKGGEASDMKENDSNQLNVPATKTTESEKVCDSLILTADDELETEMSLAEKNGKAQIEGSEPNKLAVSEESQPAPPELQDDTKADNKPAIPKNEPVESTNQEIKKDECSNLAEKEINKTTPKQDKLDNKSTAKKAGTTDNKSSNVPANASRVLWVSNVTQSVKASDLKQYITKIGKVVTAKVVTDGKKCYGYVVMDNPEDANKCLKALNNAYFEGRKISLSFTRPPRTNSDKKDEASKSVENDKPKPTKKESPSGARTSGNETDDPKIQKSKESSNKSSRNETKKRRRSHSRSRSSKVSKRQSSNDPLTTKFDSRKRARSDSRRKSRSSDRHDRKYLREKEERERLQRKLLEEQRRSRDEMHRQIQREEKHREMEFKLEQERRKLQLERELFEKERRELTRLDVERRKIERERLDVLEQRSKLQEEIQKSRMKRKPDEFTLSSVIAKPQESNKSYEQRKETPKRDDDYNRKSSNSKQSFQKTSKDSRDERKISNDCKSSVTTTSQRSVQKTDRLDFKLSKDSSKLPKNYERSAPPPPKLTNDFDRKPKHTDRKHEYSDGKSNYGDRKSERGGRKIEVIDRKYYPERSSEVPERKHERIYRKPEFEERKPHMFPERKYEYGRDTKRYRDESYPERDATQRTQWPAAPVNYNDPWKSAPPPVSGSSTTRYQEQPNFPAAPYGGPSRIPPFYYHATPAAQEYPRYDHCSQVNGRKYN